VGGREGREGGTGREEGRENEQAKARERACERDKSECVTTHGIKVGLCNTVSRVIYFFCAVAAKKKAA